MIHQVTVQTTLDGETLLSGLAESASKACNDKQINANLRENIALVRACPGVKYLKGRYLGERVIVCGAGPSLTQAIPYIRESGCPVVACDRAAKPLLENGITPAYIVAVEISPLGALKFNGVTGLGRIPLIFDPCCHPSIVDQYPGPLYTYNKPVAVMDKGDMRQGSGVIAFAVGFAEVLGADPIILSGVDLSYRTEQTHAAGVVPFDEVKLKRLKIRSVAGDLVETTFLMAANVEELSIMAKELRLIQTSPAGARIPNAEHMSIKEALA